MSLAAPYQEHYYIADGEMVTFPFGEFFQALSANYVKCAIYFSDGTSCVPTFTVDMENQQITIVTLTKPDGTVLTVPPAGSVVRVYRETPEQQNVTASQLQNYTAKQLEKIFDSMVAMQQETSYSDLHKNIRLTEPQRDISIEPLTEEKDQSLLYWDEESRQIKSTEYGQDEVIEQIERANTVADEAKTIAGKARDDLRDHEMDKGNPHETSMAKLTDTEIVEPERFQFLSFDGTKWKNVNYSATYSWGGIGGDISDQTDLFNTFVKKTGDTVSGMYKHSYGSRTRYLSANNTNKYMDVFMNDDIFTLYYHYTNSSTATLSMRSYVDGHFNIYPSSDKGGTIGFPSRRFERIYTTILCGSTNGNNYLIVPDVGHSDTIATKSQVDLAANSGRMITDQGVWYAKMYAATVAPSAEDGTNYADFSQVDGQGNPVIVTYNRVNGAWVQDQTITPPAEYDGYVPITSKIWDIAEQAGQQGGRILWNHQSKEFTPYPQIISFEDIEITGDSTVVMPATLTDNSIPNKKYVDDKFAGDTYHPDLFDWKWADHQLNDVQWLRADTFSWQDGGVYEAAYQHLVNDAEGMYDEPEFSVATQNANLGNNTWKDVAYGNGKFVALGNSGYISTSTDGINWITAIQDANLGSHIWSNIAYGNGRFVALGTTGYISTSTDGTTWSAATQDENIKNKIWWGVVYGNGKFVALTYSGYISTSTDGTTWTATTQDANLGNNTWRGIAYDGTKFVALGKDGHISTSTDGTTWTTATQNANLGSNNWYEITYDGTNFVALGEAGYISTSTDGTTWTVATQDANLGNNTWRGIAYGNETLVALGDTGYISTASNFESETIAGTTIIYYAANDGHKIVLPDQESNIAAIYAATGVAWYYVLDTANERFKLPRDNTQSQRVLIKTITSGTKWARIYADGWVEQGDTNPGTFGTVNFLITMQDTNYNINFAPTDTYIVPRITDRTTSSFSSNGRNIDNSGLTGTTSFASWEVDGYADITNVASQFDAQYKYLYFYVGNFTQSAIENTAGLNAELFNGKVDVGHEVIAFQAPTVDNNYTWYRKYADGWVEQGGQFGGDGAGSLTVNLPITMSDTNYKLEVCANVSDGTFFGAGYKSSTTQITVWTTNFQGGMTRQAGSTWEVKGMAA